MFAYIPGCISDFLKTFFIPPFSVFYFIILVHFFIIYPNWHELDRALILLIGVVAIQLFRKLNFKNKFTNFILSYVPTMVLIFGYVFLRGLRTELTQSAYRDIFFNFTAFYIIITVIDLIIRKIKK